MLWMEERWAGNTSFMSRSHKALPFTMFMHTLFVITFSYVQAIAYKCSIDNKLVDR
jgi:hypothetical protein